MTQQTLEFFSGFPALLSPNAPTILKKAKLDGRRSDEYVDRRGRPVEVSGLSRDYHVYVLASRFAMVFGSKARWKHLG